MKKINEYSKLELESLINDSNSYKDFLRKINYSGSGNSYKSTKKYLDSVNVDYGKLTSYRWSSKEKEINEVFVKDSSFCNKALKNKILRHGLLEYECQKCGNEGEWMGEPLSLHLDHINGINNDHRIENLRFLCPNCHSQTKTYAGRNNKGK